MNKEVFYLRDVFKPVHEVAKIPKSAYKAYFVFYFMLFITSLVSHFYSFLLPFATDAVEKGSIVLGVIFFLMFHLKGIVSNTLFTVSNYFSLKKGEILGIDLAKSSVNITTKVSGKVIFNNKNISNSEVMTNVGSYVSNYRETFEAFFNNCISMMMFFFSVIGSICVAVAKFDNVLLFASTMVGAVLVALLFTYKRTIESQDYHSKEAELFRKRENEKNDCINQKVISKSHSDFMLNNLLNTQRELAKYRLKNGLKENVMKIKNSAVFAIAIIVVVVDAIIAVGINNLNATNFLSIISLATVFASILSSIESQLSTINVFFALKSKVIKEKPLFTEIARVYSEEKEEQEVIGDIYLEPFEYSYPNGNFILKSKRRLAFKHGEITLVRGGNGTGKSTLLKLLSGKIKSGDNVLISTLYSPGGAELGCQSILAEITFGNVQVEKLIKILKGVCMYDDLMIKAEGKDLVKYMAQSGTTGFSDGQKRLLVLARALYNIDSYSLVILDEPFVHVDQVKIPKALAFVKEYAAQEMDKTVMVTTHHGDKDNEQFDEILDVKKEGGISIIA